MKNLITNDNKCVYESNYIVLSLMCLFFIAGYLLFKKKSNTLSPILKRKLQTEKDLFNKQIENNKSDLNFFLDQNE